MEAENEISKYENRTFQLQPIFRLSSISSQNGNSATSRFDEGEFSLSYLKDKKDERLKAPQKEKEKNETIVDSDNRSLLDPEDRLTTKKKILNSQKNVAVQQTSTSPQPKQERAPCFNPPNEAATGTDFSNCSQPKSFSLSSLKNKGIETVTSVLKEKINPHPLSPLQLNKETTYNEQRINIETKSSSTTTELLPSPHTAKTAKTMSFHSNERIEQNLSNLGPNEDNGNRMTNENVFDEDAQNFALACKCCRSPQKSMRYFPPEKVAMPSLSSPQPKDNTSWFENQTNKIIVDDDDKQAFLEPNDVPPTFLDTTTATTTRSFSKQKDERHHLSPTENRTFFEKQVKKNAVENNKHNFIKPHEATFSTTETAKTTMAVSPSEDTTYLDRSNKKGVARENQAFSKPSEHFTSPPKSKSVYFKRCDVNRPVAVILKAENMCLVEQNVHFPSKELIPQTDSDGSPLLCFLKPLPPSFDMQGNCPQQQRARTHPRVVINKQRQLVFTEADAPRHINKPPNLDLSVQNINLLKPPQKFQRLHTPSPPPSPGRLLDRPQFENKVFFGASAASRGTENGNNFSLQVRNEKSTRSSTVIDETGAKRENRRVRRVEIHEQENALRQRARRVAVCATTDTTSRERQFIRVIGKRF